MRRQEAVAWLLSILCGLLPVLFAVPAFAAEDTGIKYEVKIEGVSDGSLQAELESASDTVGLVGRPPATLKLLYRRVEGDMPRLMEACKAHGYYDAEVTFAIDRKKDDEGNVSIIVRISVNTGVPYKFAIVTINIIDHPELIPPKLTELGLEPGAQAKARAVVSAQTDILYWLKTKGFAFPSVDDRRVVVDYSAKTMAVTYDIDPGDQAKFGETRITGLKTIDEKFMLDKIPWKTGETYDAGVLAEFQKTLNDTALFATSKIKTESAEDEDGLLPITVETRERSPRTISAGLSYKTDEKLGVKAQWEHRNFFGKGERLTTSLTLAQQKQSLDTEFNKPDFLKVGQSLKFSASAASEDTDAYKSTYLKTYGGLERMIKKGITAGAGVGLRISKVEQPEIQHFDLVSFPVYFTWDTTDSLLDPTTGGRFSLELGPYRNFFGEDISFFKSFGGYSRYVTVISRPQIVLAAKAGGGSISGASRSFIPADLRFYSGGGGSVRGYPYQSVGPLDGTKPLGGRSLIEMAAELRFKVSESFGLVTFVNGGRAYEYETPDSQNHIMWAGGAGLRYFTGIGPLRLDVGVPFERRAGVDDPFQIYISLGQAF